ncbi:MAG: pyridoxamine 5'-phosphate oxidase [Bacteroidetes bacterium]|nr:MAG: pyridoxamine 5'-phosphate oxidase [Bacteroidota bacterium]
MNDFLKKMRDDHHEFDRGQLEDQYGKNPYELFQQWYDEAQHGEVLEANAFALATVNSEGLPSSRILYLKELDQEEFVFYTNYQSRKGEELAANSQASMLFFWPELQRQIRIEGKVTRVADSLSDAYFASRPRGSQIGAWASQQSQLLTSRQELEDRIAELEKQYTGEVPRPPHWGGYALSPESLEFWQGRASRLHDRIYFERKGSSWDVCRLNP